MSLQLLAAAPRMVPSEPPLPRVVAPNYQQWDGLQEMDVPAGEVNAGSAPGFSETPLDQQTYTPSPQRGLTNSLGGQPLTVGAWEPGARTHMDVVSVHGPGRLLGDGQDYQGVAQTAFFGELQSSPPVPGDMQSIIGGWG